MQSNSLLIIRAVIQHGTTESAQNRELLHFNLCPKVLIEWAVYSPQMIRELLNEASDRPRPVSRCIIVGTTYETRLKMLRCFQNGILALLNSREVIENMR